MNGIYADGKGRVVYYGSFAGYVEESSAVLDEMFRCAELESWLGKNGLNAKWTAGVYERLSTGGTANAGEPLRGLKNCRIWQLKPGAGAWNDLVRPEKPLSDPVLSDYAQVYDGQIGTDDLEEIYSAFTEKCPSGFSGHPLSASDVIELHDDSGSTFYFIDRTGFREVNM